MRFLVTGCAGFIGSTLTDRLLADGHEVKGVDCFTDFYDVDIKRRNIDQALQCDRFKLYELDLATAILPPDFAEVDGVFHLAAQAGVRASWGTEFATYTDCNVLATQRLLELFTNAPAKNGNSPTPPRFVYASSSSIYGNALDLPTLEATTPDPVSPYGVTKLAGEHLMSTYHHNHGFHTISLRFFTVYGERQRPDMAFNRFIRSLGEGAPIRVYGDGSQSRDFTYVSDIVDGAVRAMMASNISFGTYNLGGGVRVGLLDVIDTLATIMNVSPDLRFDPAQAGDVKHTSADITAAARDLGYSPATSLTSGLEAQVAWLRTARPDQSTR